jgi:uncharacterized protein (TIGR02271 family)
MAYETTSNVGGIETRAPVLVGIFNDAGDAHSAITQLRENGFTSNQIGAAFRDRFERESDAGYAGSEAAGGAGRRHESWWEKLKDAFRFDESKEARRRDSAELDNAALNTERTSPTLDHEQYEDEQYEYELTGSDLEGSLAGTGVPRDRAANLTRNLRPGGAIVTVRAEDRTAEAERILSANHGLIRYEDVPGARGDTPGKADIAPAAPAGAATGVSTTAAAQVTPATGEAADTAYADRRPLDPSSSAVDRVQLFGEVLRVHKERVSRGEVRLRKDVVTENQTIQVPVTREELVLERVAVQGDTPAPNANIGEQQEVRVPLSGETLRTEKEPVLREEVVVSKREVTDMETVDSDVRREELRVDREGAAKPATAENPAVDNRDRRRA